MDEIHDEILEHFSDNYNTIVISRKNFNKILNKVWKSIMKLKKQHRRQIIDLKLKMKRERKRHVKHENRQKQMSLLKITQVTDKLEKQAQKEIESLQKQLEKAREAISGHMRMNLENKNLIDEIKSLYEKKIQALERALHEHENKKEVNS